MLLACALLAACTLPPPPPPDPIETVATAERAPAIAPRDPSADEALAARVLYALAADPALRDDAAIEASAYRGTVLLYGTRPTAELAARAVQLAKQVAGVSRVLDQTRAGPHPSAAQYERDRLLATRVRLTLYTLLDLPGFLPEQVESAASGGAVYLLGQPPPQHVPILTEALAAIPDLRQVIVLFEPQQRQADQR